ncbi:hypothetical protein J32TS6_35440 [Virgibacillus pantothenticus]|nr:hypothetical protein J32TS6_35440 [Virgibacillus pantothenticus]SIT07091.1 DNase/tRNase domain of colicin-like bacteriocin [Virgibacillus pantothenticus]
MRLKVHLKITNRIVNIQWKDRKQVVSLTKEQLASKPPYSRDPIKRQKKGGKIEIDEHGIWTYIDWEVPPNKVSYPNGFPDFKSAGLVIQEVQLKKFKSYSVDCEVADKLAPNGPKSSKNTWHHHEDLKTMQEVNKVCIEGLCTGVVWRYQKNRSVNMNINPFKGATEELISNFEKMIGFSLPTDYKQFLLRYNGGTTKKRYSTFFVKELNQIIQLDVLYGIGVDDEAFDLET